MRKLFVHKDISKAKTLITDFYTDPDYFNASREKIFSRCWHIIGDTGFVKEPGNCYPFTLLEGYLNEPLILTRDKQDQVHCVSNVCTHRGNLLVDQPCKTSNIRCKYHGRLFQLDGTFYSMPEFKEVKNFPTAEDNLHQLPLEQWGNLLFTSLNKKLAAKKFLKPMIKRMEWLPMDKFVFRADLSKVYQVNAHWALYCENYLEGFHIPFVHANLNAVIDYGNYSAELFRYSNLQIGVAKENQVTFDLPPSSPDYGKNIAAYYFWVFPNMMFNFYPWGLSVNVVNPVSIDHTKVYFLNYVWNEEKLGTGAGANLEKVEHEDEEVVQNVQKGIRSRYYDHGRYSVTKEQGTHHFHRLVSEFMKN